MLLQGCYRVTRLLSNPNKPSGFGTIYEVEDSNTKKILKILHNTHPKAIELFQQEAQVLSRLQHPGIPTVENDGYFIYFPRNSQNPLHSLVMEKIEGMNLEEYFIERQLQPIAEFTAIRWLKQLTEIPQDTQEILQKIAELNPRSYTSQQVFNNPLPNVGLSQVVTPNAGKKINLFNSEQYILFCKRSLAFMIDLVIVGILAFFWYIVLVASRFTSASFIILIAIINAWLYFALLESSYQQATLGKKTVKIIVTNLQGNRISFWQATWRFLMKVFFTYLSSLGIGLIDFIFTLLRKDKRSLHDLLARTFVVDKK